MAYPYIKEASSQDWNKHLNSHKLTQLQKSKP
ncbi:hypothetical protein CCACVL1_13762 [Corchorus capsularis]|uniref:Uncharacterized protein n=1 Tax=Corchorus capsularis TaxID=210143 RepID=A0A1R3I9T2_COCAP|nr:hypothetical protein CCACVL1_13762 [Corchorus capsularis]